MKLYQGVPRFTYRELVDLPTITVGQSDDLKVEMHKEGRTYRVWLSRLTQEDGAPFRRTASVEGFNRRTGQWDVLCVYNAERTSETCG